MLNDLAAVYFVAGSESRYGSPLKRGLSTTMVETRKMLRLGNAFPTCWWYYTHTARSRHSKHKLVWCQLTKPPHHGVHPVASLPAGSALPAWLVLVECRQPKYQSQIKSYRKVISADTGNRYRYKTVNTKNIIAWEVTYVHILGRYTFLSLEMFVK